ncbi:hypothetical protein ATCC90586_009871 [Pythium insidiosum]|nr:hypothetical protein ATCC90586_009871 [Pythium insidiosum]
MAGTTDVAPPGALACQRDSSLRELRTRVVAVEAGADGAFDVELQDTVLFPEGGGQPCDTGRLNDVRVESVAVKQGRCLHRVAARADGSAPLVVGDEVTAAVDWDRRFDHMQQHSGQHLLSAICEKYGYDTTTWSLGDERCNVELVPYEASTGRAPSPADAPKGKTIPAETLAKIEREVNAAIVAGRSMVPSFVTQGTPEWERVASKFEPSQRPDALRVMVIDGIDWNPCCGTHVQSLAQLQSLRLLHTEYARGASRVWFVVGERVNREFSRMFQREQHLTKLLSCAPDEHASRVDKLLQAQRSANKELKALQKEVAAAVAAELLAKRAESPVVHYHRPDADLAFLQSIVAGLGSEGEARGASTFVLTAGDARGDGCFVLVGPQAVISQHGKRLIEEIDGKGGGGRNGVMQGKAKALQRVSALLESLRALQL